MNPSVSDLIGRTIGPPHAHSAAAQAPSSAAALPPLPLLMAWIAGPPAPMPTLQSLVMGVPKVIVPAENLSAMTPEITSA